MRWGGWVVLCAATAAVFALSGLGGPLASLAAAVFLVALPGVGAGAALGPGRGAAGAPDRGLRQFGDRAGGDGPVGLVGLAGGASPVLAAGWHGPARDRAWETGLPRRSREAARQPGPLGRVPRSACSVCPRSSRRGDSQSATGSAPSGSGAAGRRRSWCGPSFPPRRASGVSSRCFHSRRESRKRSSIAASSRSSSCPGSATATCSRHYP